MSEQQQDPREVVVQAMYGKRMVNTWLMRGRKMSTEDELVAFAAKKQVLIEQMLPGWVVVSGWVKAGVGEPHELRLEVAPDADAGGVGVFRGVAVAGMV